MQDVLTLVAGEGRSLTDTDVARAADIVHSITAARPGNTEWLSPQEACDLPLSSLSDDKRTQLRAALLELAAEQRFDFGILPGKGRRKKVLIADMDSTIVTGETLDDLAGEFGLKDRIAAITARAMNGEIDFKDALRERVLLLKGLEYAAVTRVLDKLQLNTGAEQLVRTMRANGAHTALVSGGFRMFTQHVCQLVGFHTDQANELEIEAECLSGRVREPILDREAKVVALKAAAEANGALLSECIAVGDGANDLAMLAEAGIGIAYRAKPVVAAAAQVRVDHADLRALLWFQGYRADEVIG